MITAILFAVAAWIQPTGILGFLPPPLPEASGMATSLRQPGAVWLLNDGDHPARLFRLAPEQPQNFCSWAVDGVENRDWEALASFRQYGEPWLAIADVGDNNGVHELLQIVLTREPGQCGGTITPARTVRFRLPDGPADIEAMVVDAAEPEALLISKRSRPPRVYAVSLQPSDGIAQAREIARLDHLRPPSPAAVAADPDMGPWLNQPTGAALSPAGDLLAVLTYEYVYLFRRDRAEPWGDVLARPAHDILDFPRLPQQEAIAFLDRRTLLMTTENHPAPLLALPVNRD